MKLRTNKKQNRESPPLQEFAIKMEKGANQGGRGKKPSNARGDNSYLSASTIITEAQITGRILNRSQWRWILPGQGTLGTNLSATT